MNTFILENLMANFSYFLILFVILLIFGVFLIVVGVDIKNRNKNKQLKSLGVFKDAFEMAPYPAVIINRTGHILESNNAAMKFFDMSKEELEEEFLDAYTIISSSIRLSETMQENIKDKGFHLFKNEVKIHGKRVPSDFTLIPLVSGRKARFLVLIEQKPDEERKEFEQNLLAARLDEVENAAGIGYWVYDYENDKTIWSRGLYKILAKDINTTKPDLSFLAQFAPESQKSVQNLLLAIKNQQPYYDRVVVRGDDGIRRTVDLYLKHQEGLNVDVQRSMGILREVREFSVAENENFYGNLWMHINKIEDVLILLVDNEGTVKFISEYALSILDCELDDILDSNIADYTDKNGNRPFEAINQNLDQFFTNKINDSLIHWQSMADSIDNYNFSFLTGIDLTDCMRIYRNNE